MSNADVLHKVLFMSFYLDVTLKITPVHAYFPAFYDARLRTFVLTQTEEYLQTYLFKKISNSSFLRYKEAKRFVWLTCSILILMYDVF